MQRRVVPWGDEVFDGETPIEQRLDRVPIELPKWGDRAVAGAGDGDDDQQAEAADPEGGFRQRVRRGVVSAQLLLRIRIYLHVLKEFNSI